MLKALHRHQTVIGAGRICNPSLKKACCPHLHVLEALYRHHAVVSAGGLEFHQVGRQHCQVLDAALPARCNAALMSALVWGELCGFGMLLAKSLVPALLHGQRIMSTPAW